ncbi:MAG: uroporphyrinogen-III synthase [Saprospiraceae bacterium]|nr:uroporphyrinogen-III synthase [Saprospiraceae bacterium]
MTDNLGETYKPVRTILVSQPKPARSPYYELEKKYDVVVDFRSFIHVEAVPLKEYRKQRINISDYSAIIFTSKNSIDHFFSVCEELRVKISQDTKYFCLTESIALYLQKFIIYRKRKVFFGARTIHDLKDSLLKHKKKEKFLLPCSNLGKEGVQRFLRENEFDYQDAIFYKTVSSDLSDLENVTYDVLVFFSPQGIDSLYENFPDFKQNDTRIAVFGPLTKKAVEDRGLTIDILVDRAAPSMSMALEKYLKNSNKIQVK